MNLDLPKRKPGRPQKFTKDELMGIYNGLNEYIEKADDPTLAGFIATQPPGLNKQFLSSHKEFSDLVQKAIQKQEAFLLSQYKNPAMAIFRLKQPQHGYTDKREVEQKSLNLDVQVDGELADNFLKYLKNSTSQS